MLRELYEAGQVHPTGFTHYFTSAGAHERRSSEASSAPLPSYEWFEAAAEESVPYYRVEVAKSGRSNCKANLSSIACNHENPEINAGEVRVGTMNLETGPYPLLR